MVRDKEYNVQHIHVALAEKSLKFWIGGHFGHSNIRISKGCLHGLYCIGQIYVSFD